MLADALLSTFSASLGALVAAWVGTRLGLRKFQSERAFDARVEWHRNLAETAKVLLNRTRALAAFQRGNTPEEVALPLTQELGQLAFKFQELAEQASLYASKPTCAAIQEVLGDMTKSSQVFAKVSESPDAVSESEGQAMFAASMQGLERVYDLLAKDLRKMFGLEQLD